MPAPTVNAASQVFLGIKYQRSQKLIYWQTFKEEGKIDFKEGVFPLCAIKGICPQNM